MESIEGICSLYLKGSPLNASPEVIDEGLQCLVCEHFITNEDINQSIAISLQKHLLTKHNLMIADIETIADLKSYLDYYRPKFAESDDWNRFCALISTNRFDCI